MAGVGFHFHVLSRIELPYRVQESYNTGSRQIFEVNVLRQALTDLKGNTFDEGKKLHRQLLAVAEGLSCGVTVRSDGRGRAVRMSVYGAIQS
jgi:hypothetical protein